MNSEHVKFLSEANVAAMEAKARLQQEAQAKRVADLVAEVRDRLDSLVSKAYGVRSDIGQVEDGDTSHFRGYPLGAFGSTASDIDGLLEHLHKEVEHLHGLRRAEEETHALSEQFGERGARLAEQMDDDDPRRDGAIPMPTGQYL